MRRKYFLVVGIMVAGFLTGCSSTPRMAASGGNGGGSGTGNTVTVSVSAPSSTVGLFGTLPFTANVTGNKNKAVTWEVNGINGGNSTIGFISNAGLFVAPRSLPLISDGKGGVVPAIIKVQAVSQADGTAFGSMVVTITAAANQSAQSGAVLLGTSGGNANDSSAGFCCSGTLGALIQRNGVKYILSNNHVLAKSDFATAGGPPNGDGISQPGLVENNCSLAGSKMVANLSEFFNLQNGSGTKVDAAIAQVQNGMVDPNGNILLLGATATNGIPDPGAPRAGTGVNPVVNMAVAKSGRTSGLTCSTVVATLVTTKVDYFKNCGDDAAKPPKPAAFTVNFSNLVAVAGGDFSAGGDSGSLIVMQDTADPVALLFAGSDQDTVGNPVSDVLNFFTAKGGSQASFVGGGAHQVIGCSLPVKPASAIAGLFTTALASVAIQSATVIRDAHAPELMRNSQVQAIGVGRSYDNPNEAAILFFVNKGQMRVAIPAHVDGVRTRIIEGEFFAHRGSLSVQESDEMEQGSAKPQIAYSISQDEQQRARKIHSVHAEELLKQPGVQGVGITSSVDSPGEAALMIYLVRGEVHGPIPAVIDGMRTRVREGSRFRAGNWGIEARQTCSAPKMPRGTATARPVYLYKQ